MLYGLIFLLLDCSQKVALSVHPNTPVVHHKSLQERQSTWLKERIATIRPWEGAYDYTDKDWAYLVTLAKQVQTMPTVVVSRAISIWYRRDTRAFLLMKVVFYRPLKKTNHPYILTAHTVGNTDPESLPDEDKFDIPISWEGGCPHLVASCLPFGSGFADLGMIYRYMKESYSLRSIQIPKKWKHLSKQIERSTVPPRK